MVALFARFWDFYPPAYHDSGIALYRGIVLIIAR